MNNKVFELIDRVTLEYIGKEENAENWKNYQKLMNCCGFKGEGKTGELCQQPDVKDCRVDMISVFSDYLLYVCIVLCVLTIVIYIISCSSNRYLKEGVCQFHFC